jgi:hypothetical protein
MPRQQRSDKGKRRESYTANQELRGKVDKENAPLKSFWSFHKMDQVMQLTHKELDNLINSWIEIYQENQMKRNKGWWYPTVGGLTLHEVRNKRTNIDKGPMI